MDVGYFLRMFQDILENIVFDLECTVREPRWHRPLGILFSLGLFFLSLFILMVPHFSMFGQVRSVAGMVVIQVMFTNSFLSLRFFAPAVLAFGNDVIFFFFGAAATIGGLTTIFLIPETKGKSIQEIQELLSR